MFDNWLGPLSRKQKFNFFIIIFGLFFSTFIEIASISIVPVFLTIILIPEKIPEFLYNFEIIKVFFNASRKDLILKGSLILLFIFIFKNIYLFILIIYEKNFLRKVNINNATNLYKFFINSNLLFHLQRNSTKLHNVLTNVNEQYVEYVRCLIMFIKESLIVISVFFILFYYQPKISSIVFGLFILVAAIYYFYFRKILFNRGVIRQEFCDQQVKTIYETFGSIKESKILQIENFFINKFVSETKGKEYQQMFLQIIQSIPRLIIEILIVIFIIIIVYFYYFNNYSVNSFLPILSFFSISAIRLMPAFNSIIFSSTSLKFLSNSLRIINKEIGLISSNFKNISNNKNKIEFKKNIILEDVSFSYPNTILKTITDINLQINCGQIVGFIGKSGVGKSTLIDLILGLHNLSNGRILVDGIDIADSKSQWFNLLGYVPQDIYLSDDSVANNIAFGVTNDSIDIKRLNETIKLAQLDSFIGTLFEGVDSKVGDRGRRISTGQKQRIGIARALYRNSKILILDEATSSLDHETERDLIQTVLEINKNKNVTIIFIAHKLNTLKICDNLFLINDGKLIDKGNYNYMLSKYSYLKDYYKDE
ncbi:ABC transporter ATP-binding protein/permease [Pelagibacteraceae bacterium]|nr:ABC transporter ATP-binding protein/permease [Pelagibacteraceae bacterium]